MKANQFWIRPSATWNRESRIHRSSRQCQWYSIVCCLVPLGPSGIIGKFVAVRPPWSFCHTSRGRLYCHPLSTGTSTDKNPNDFGPSRNIKLNQAKLGLQLFSPVPSRWAAPSPATLQGAARAPNGWVAPPAMSMAISLSTVSKTPGWYDLTINIVFILWPLNQERDEPLDFGCIPFSDITKFMSIQSCMVGQPS